MKVLAWAALFVVVAAGAQETSQQPAEGDLPEASGEVMVVIQPDGSVAFGQATSVTEAPTSRMQVGESGFAKHSISEFASELALESLQNGYRFYDAAGNVMGMYMFRDQAEAQRIAAEALTMGWTVSPQPIRVGSFPGRAASDMVRLDDEAVMTRVRGDLMEKAKKLACTSTVRPVQVSVSAQLHATGGFVIAEVGGTIGFQLTWDTVALCEAARPTGG